MKQKTLITMALACLVLMAGTLAAQAPYISIHFDRIDPALAGGVVLTTVTDVVGFFAFLGLATLFLL